MDSWVRKTPWRWDRLPTAVFLGFSGGSDDNETTCSAEDLSSTPGLGIPPGEGNGYPLQYSGLENSKDRGAWQTMVHSVTKSLTRLNDFHFHADIMFPFSDKKTEAKDHYTICSGTHILN